jgi:hypothetical protein
VVSLKLSRCAEREWRGGKFRGGGNLFLGEGKIKIEEGGWKEEIPGSPRTKGICQSIRTGRSGHRFSPGPMRPPEFR